MSKPKANPIKHTVIKGEDEEVISLYVDDLDLLWTKDELTSFFTFNNHEPVSLEFAGTKSFRNAYIVYSSSALVIAALKYYHGMRYKGQLFSVYARDLAGILPKNKMPFRFYFFIFLFFLLCLDFFGARIMLLFLLFYFFFFQQ